VRQMLRRVQVEDAGNTRFIPGEQVERAVLLDQNEKVQAEGGKPATYSYMLLGITKASLSTDSSSPRLRSRRPLAFSPRPRSWARRTNCGA